MNGRRWSFLSLTFFVLLLGMFFRPIAFGKIPFPSDALVGLYHPFRDLYQRSFPNGVPFKNFLLTDPVLQTYPWREFAIDEIKHGRLPLWNPYTFSGTPLFANIQSAVLNPFNIFLFIFPFLVGWVILIVLQSLLGGLFFFLYARKLNLHPLAAIFGGVSWVMGGFFLGWLEWGTIGFVAMWVPFLLWCVESLREKETRIVKALFILTFFASFVSGHLQTSFYVSLLVVFYGFVRLSCRRLFFTLVVLSILLASVQLLPTAELLFFSARGQDLGGEGITNAFLPWKHLVMFFAPDFFGNPTTLNYWGEWNYLEFIGYVGVMPLLLVCSVLSWKHRLTRFFSLVGLLALLFALSHPLSRLQLFLPFFSTAAPSRLLFLVDFSLAVLAAFGLDQMIRRKVEKKRWIIIGLIFSGVYLSIWIWTNFLTSEHQHIATRNLILPTLLFIVGWSIGFLTITKKKIVFVGIIVIVFLTSFDLLRFAQKFTPFASAESVYPTMRILEKISEDPSDFRIMGLDRRILPPNSTIPYRIKTIEGYDPVYFASYGQYVASMEQGRNERLSLAFHRIITPMLVDNEKFRALGVKYVLSLTDIENKQWVKIDQEGETKLYLNENFKGISYASPHFDRFVTRTYSLMIGVGLSMIGGIGGIYVVASKNR